MARMYLSIMLDFFQPAHQTHSIIEEFTRQCYRPLFELFNCHGNARFTVSMANSLAGLLQEYGESDVLAELRKAVESRRVELIHTAAYGPILPLLPDHEVRRQIELDIQFKQQQFGLTTRGGILSPEMAYDDRLVPLFRELGFHWMVVDDQVMEHSGVAVPAHDILCIGGFAVLMRSSLWTDRLWKKDSAGGYLTGREFVRLLSSEAEGQHQDSYRILALTAETFGQHIPYYDETFLRDMLFALDGSDTVRLCCLSDLLEIESLCKKEKSRVLDGGFEYFPPSSCATDVASYQRGDCYPLWKSAGNPIHEKLWALTNLILDYCRRLDFTSPSNRDLRELLDRAFYSTQYFSASVWYWNPDLIYEGLDRQMRALYKCAETIHSPNLLTEGSELYAALMWEIFRETEGRSKKGGSQ